MKKTAEFNKFDKVSEKRESDCNIIANQIKMNEQRMKDLYTNFVFKKLIKDSENPKKIVRIVEEWRDKEAKGEYNKLRKSVKFLKRQL